LQHFVWRIQNVGSSKILKLGSLDSLLVSSKRVHNQTSIFIIKFVYCNIYIMASKLSVANFQSEQPNQVGI